MTIPPADCGAKLCRAPSKSSGVSACRDQIITQNTLFSESGIGVAREALLFAAIGFLIGGFDDLLIGLIWMTRHAARSATIFRRHPRATLQDFLEPADRLAVVVPAWDAGAVAARMLRTLLARLDCPGLVVFAGCYPNDPVMLDVAGEDDRLALVINPRPGPTTKADNNAMWHAVERHESTSGQRFDAVVLHDAEDVVATGELRLFAHLLGRAEVVQLPELPLIDRGARWVSGHYCDEFAKSHVKQMVVREALGAALPLAGTGFAIDRALLGKLAIIVAAIHSMRIA